MSRPLLVLALVAALGCQSRNPALPTTATLTVGGGSSDGTRTRGEFGPPLSSSEATAVWAALGLTWHLQPVPVEVTRQAWQDARQIALELDERDRRIAELEAERLTVEAARLERIAELEWKIGEAEAAARRAARSGGTDSGLYGPPLPPGYDPDAEGGGDGHDHPDDAGGVLAHAAELAGALWGRFLTGIGEAGLALVLAVVIPLVAGFVLWRWRKKIAAWLSPK